MSQGNPNHNLTTAHFCDPGEMLCFGTCHRDDVPEVQYVVVEKPLEKVQTTLGERSAYFCSNIISPEKVLF